MSPQFDVIPRASYTAFLGSFSFLRDSLIPFGTAGVKVRNAEDHTTLSSLETGTAHFSLLLISLIRHQLKLCSYFFIGHSVRVLCLGVIEYAA